MDTSQIRIYDILQQKFTKEDSQKIVSDMQNLHEVGLVDKIDAIVSKAESRITGGIIYD